MFKVTLKVLVKKQNHRGSIRTSVIKKQKTRKEKNQNINEGFIGSFFFLRNFPISIQQTFDIYKDVY